MVRAADEVVRPGREEHVAGERPQLHAVAAAVGRERRPLGALVEAPADVREPVGVGVVEVGHVLADELGLVAVAADLGDPARLDRELDRLGHVLLERQQDVAAVDDDAAVDAVVLAAGQHHPARRPVVPLPGLVDVAVLRLDRVADPVGDVGAGAVREAQRARRRQRLDGRVGAALELVGREHAARAGRPARCR